MLRWKHPMSTRINIWRTAYINGYPDTMKAYAIFKTRVYSLAEWQTCRIPSYWLLSLWLLHFTMAVVFMRISWRAPSLTGDTRMQLFHQTAITSRSNLIESLVWIFTSLTNYILLIIELLTWVCCLNSSIGLQLTRSITISKQSVTWISFIYIYVSSYAFHLAEL